MSSRGCFVDQHPPSPAPMSLCDTDSPSDEMKDDSEIHNSPQSPLTPFLRSRGTPISISPPQRQQPYRLFPTLSSASEKLTGVGMSFFLSRFSPKTPFEIFANAPCDPEYLADMMQKLQQKHAIDQPFDYTKHLSAEERDNFLDQRATLLNYTVYRFRSEFSHVPVFAKFTYLKCVHTVDRVISIVSSRQMGVLPSIVKLAQRSACTSVLADKLECGLPYRIPSLTETYFNLTRGYFDGVDADFAKTMEFDLLKDLDFKLHSLCVEDFFEPLVLLLESLLISSYANTKKWGPRILGIARCYADAAMMQYHYHDIPGFSQRMLASACFCRACEFVFADRSFVWGDEMEKSPFVFFTGFTRKQLAPLVDAVGKDVCCSERFRCAQFTAGRVTVDFDPAVFGRN